MLNNTRLLQKNSEFGRKSFLRKRVDKVKYFFVTNDLDSWVCEEREAVAARQSVPPLLSITPPVFTPNFTGNSRLFVASDWRNRSLSIGQKVLTV